MKKFLLTLAVLAFGAFASNAETIYELTFNANNNEKGVSAYDQSWNVTVGETVWNIECFNNNNNGWEFVRCGSSKAATVATITNASAWSEKINQIVINVLKRKSGAADKVNSAVVEVLSSVDATEAVASYDITEQVNGLPSTYSDITVDITEPAADMFYRIKFDMDKTTNNGWLEIKSVIYNGIQEGPVLQDPELTFPESEYSVMYGTNFVYPTATAVSDGAITYSSADEAVATVDATTGAVEIIAIGTTKIVASIEATDVYKAAKAEYVLNVIDPKVIYSSAMGEDFTFEQVSGDMQPWSHDAKYGLKGSAYKSGAGYATEAIAVSPVIDLTEREKITLDFSQAFNQYKINGTMIDVADFNGYAYVVVKEENATEWTVIDNAITAPSKFSWDFYTNDTVNIDAYKGKRIIIGFKYVSTAECAGTWEIKAITVKGDTRTGVENLTVEGEGETVYYNMQGVRVANPENGLYIVVKGGKSSKVLF